MRWLDEQGIGLAVGPARVPIVPAAVLFDLWLGDPRIRPDADAGWRACAAASRTAPAEGSVGAGAGAAVGKAFGIDRAMKGGIGSASASVGGVTVGALVAANPIGDVIDPASGAVIAGARSADGSRIVGTTASLLAGDAPPRPHAGSATTIGVIATDARLTKAQAQRLAMMAHDGLARTIDPVHTPFDGDTLFCVATGKSASEVKMLTLGALAARVTAQAVLRAVQAATPVSSANGHLTIPSVASLAATQRRV
jgi:L-aminopeptidase/D-esterase-like protein